MPSGLPLAVERVPQKRDCLARTACRYAPAPFRQSTRNSTIQNLMSTCDIGLIGLAVMGENLVLNMESRGFHVAVYNRTTASSRSSTQAAARAKISFSPRRSRSSCGALKRPRRAQIMVKAGAPVDAVIEQLVPLLEPGDIIIDGGNSLWTDTQRREKALKEKGIHFFGVGVSGGEEGALNGPSIMPGGSKEGWEALAPIYTKIAAIAEGEPCCRHIGRMAPVTT